MADDDNIRKRYAAETAGMPANLARIAARNLARQDANISRLNEIRGRIEENLPENVAARAAKYRERVFDVEPSIPQGAVPGYYAGSKYLGPLGGAIPRGATGIVGGQTGPDNLTPNIPLDPTAVARGAVGLHDPGLVRSFLPFGESFAGDVASSFLPSLGRFAARGATALPGISGIPGLAALSGAASFFPAIRSFFNRNRPRPYNPAPALQNVAAPSPTPRPSPSPGQSPNPYYAYDF